MAVEDRSAPPTAVHIDVAVYVGTFLFTDMEDSTRWIRQLGDERWLELLATHRNIIGEACANRGGTPEGVPQGDGLLYFFDDSLDAAWAAAEIQRTMRDHRWPGPSVPGVRIGLHAGVVGWSTDTGRTGLEMNRANRIMNAARGGQILLSDAARVHLRGGTPPATELIPVGSYRLKGFGDEPQRLYELVVDGAPGPYPLRATPATAPSYPRYGTPLIGRRSELVELRSLILTATDQLVTLVGPGGIGKTRLAVEILAGLRHDDGLFIDLSQLDEPSLLVQHLAGSLGLSTSPPSDPVDLVAAELAHRAGTVVVLDNFEQILSAAWLVGELVERCRCHFVVTSRTRLGLPGERVYRVEPLAVTSPDASSSPAAQLFLTAMTSEVRGPERLGPHDSGTVERVCDRLDGLPLAIELAAARANLIGLDGLELALDRPLSVLGTSRTARPERQRSITDTIAWSFDLLPSPASRVFLCLAPLPGGCGLDLLPNLCGMDAAATLDAIELLVEAHLVVRDPAHHPIRFRLPRLIRDYGVEELERRHQLTEARMRAGELVATLAADARDGSHDRDPLVALDRIDDELDNVRALLGWGLDGGPVGDLALGVAAELVSYWWVRHPEEGFRWLRRLIEHNAGSTSRFMAPALIRAAFLASVRGEADVVIDYATQGITACADAGRPSGTLSMGLHLRALAWAAIDDRRHWRLARRSLRQCLEIDETLEGTERAIHRSNVADVYLADGRLDDAARLYEESLTIFRSQGTLWFLAAPTSRLGEIALRRGDLTLARRLLTESIGQRQEGGSRAGTARTVAGLGRVARAEGRLSESHRLTAEAWSVMEETSSTGEAPWVVAGLAAMAFDRGSADRAVQLMGGAARLAHAFGQPVVACIRSELADVYEGALATVGRRAFKRWWHHYDELAPTVVLADAERMLS